MAYMSVLGECFGCRKSFWFNAERVPSIRVQGEREPICQDCVNVANPKRIANGLAPIVVLPGAYEAQEVP